MKAPGEGAYQEPLLPGIPLEAGKHSQEKLGNWQKPIGVIRLIRKEKLPNQQKMDMTEGRHFGSSLKLLVGRDQFLTGSLDGFIQSYPLLHPNGNVSKQWQELSKKELGHSTAPKTQELVTVQSLVIFMFSQHLHVIGIYECINILRANKPIH